VFPIAGAYFSEFDFFECSQKKIEKLERGILSRPFISSGAFEWLWPNFLSNGGRDEEYVQKMVPRAE
jgi:hypothetical protein